MTERPLRSAPAPPVPRAELAARYSAVRRATEALVAPLSAEDAALQSMPDASPAKWHLAHTSWFFETFVLRPSLPGYTVLDPAYERLFNSYYLGIGNPHPRARRGLLSRPSLDQVYAYRRHVDAATERLLGAELAPGLAELVELGLQHEQQHQELVLTDVKHLLSCHPGRPAYRPGARPHPVSPPAARREAAGPAGRGAVPALAWHPHPGGIVRIGAGEEGFAFDNERPRHRRWLEPFALATRLVTNGEWRAFVEDGGYARPELWLSDGWNTVRAEGWSAPLYWERDGDGWLEFGLSGLEPLEDDAPVCHVSGYEADAYARWAGARLPGEDEWEVVAHGVPVAGNLAPGEAPHPRPLAAAPDGAPAQLWGDVWEWTRSAYAPYPGYAPPPGPVGEYNGKFMSGQLVLRGGSCATPADHVRASYRNFFPPAARWQFTGVRLAKDLR